MDLLLELARTKVTNRYLAENLSLDQAEKLRHDLTEVCRFLERRIQNEKAAKNICDNMLRVGKPRSLTT